MPTIELTDRELRALQAVYGNPARERVDWVGFDRAKAKILAAPAAPNPFGDRPEELETLVD